MLSPEDNRWARSNATTPGIPKVWLARVANHLFATGEPRRHSIRTSVSIRIIRRAVSSLQIAGGWRSPRYHRYPSDPAHSKEFRIAKVAQRRESSPFGRPTSIHARSPFVAASWHPAERPRPRPVARRGGGIMNRVDRACAIDDFPLLPLIRSGESIRRARVFGKDRVVENGPGELVALHRDVFESSVRKIRMAEIVVRDPCFLGVLAQQAVSNLVKQPHPLLDLPRQVPVGLNQSVVPFCYFLLRIVTRIISRWKPKPHRISSKRSAHRSRRCR
jgi:hypothetical protein